MIRLPPLNDPQRTQNSSNTLKPTGSTPKPSNTLKPSSLFEAGLKPQSTTTPASSGATTPTLPKIIEPNGNTTPASSSATTPTLPNIIGTKPAPPRTIRPGHNGRNNTNLGSGSSNTSSEKLFIALDALLIRRNPGAVSCKTEVTPIILEQDFAKFKMDSIYDNDATDKIIFHAKEMLKSKKAICITLSDNRQLLNFFYDGKKHFITLGTPKKEGEPTCLLDLVSAMRAVKEFGYRGELVDLFNLKEYVND